MSTTATRTRSRATKKKKTKAPGWFGPALLWLAGIRTVLAIIAIPLAPALYRKHFVVLVLLRPTKEVLLAGGFLVRQHKVSLPMLMLASIPLLLLGVWHFYAIGRVYGDRITGDKMPKLARKLLPAKRIKAMCRVLEKRGTPVVLMGRLAAFPSTVIATAAGASDLETRRFLGADGVGGLLSFVEVVGAGYALGQAYEEAGPWLTWGGVAMLAVVAVLFGWWLKKV